METYTFLRELADSWVLLAMCLFYIGAILFLFRPSAWRQHKDASQIPFRYETGPETGCNKDCENCACDSLSTTFLKEPA